MGQSLQGCGPGKTSVLVPKWLASASPSPMHLVCQHHHGLCWALGALWWRGFGPYPQEALCGSSLAGPKANRGSLVPAWGRDMSGVLHASGQGSGWVSRGAGIGQGHLEKGACQRGQVRR